jgi:putative MFS transporter
MPSPEPDPSDRRTRPRWLRLVPFIGRPPPLTPRQWRVFGLVSAATLFDQYDRSLFAMALPQIQADLAIGEAQVGVLGSIVRLGALPAFALALAADRLGRRRLLLFTILAYTLLTGATALAPDARSFVALQFLARIFTTAEVLLAVVVLSEELDPGVRGWGIGALFAIQACGVGLAAALLPLVELSAGSWRILYAVGLVPLLLLAWWRRALPETERFEAHRRRLEDAPQIRQLLAPAVALVRDYPARFALVSTVIFVGAASGAAADFFGPKYLQQAHGWEPSDVSILYLAGGAFAIGGAALAGWLSDRFGRRSVAVVLSTLLPLLAIAFYNGGGWWLPPLWMALIVVLLGSETVFATYGTELFPTSYRSTASGARVVVATLGVVLGLSLESLLYALLGSHWTAVTVMLGAGLLTPLLVGLFFPETAGRSLESIAPERGLAPEAPLPTTRPEEIA